VIDRKVRFSRSFEGVVDGDLITTSFDPDVYLVIALREDRHTIPVSEYALFSMVVYFSSTQKALEFYNKR